MNWIGQLSGVFSTLPFIWEIWEKQGEIWDIIILRDFGKRGVSLNFLGSTRMPYLFLSNRPQPVSFRGNSCIDHCLNCITGIVFLLCKRKSTETWDKFQVLLPLHYSWAFHHARILKKILGNLVAVTNPPLRWTELTRVWIQVVDRHWVIPLTLSLHYQVPLLVHEAHHSPSRTTRLGKYGMTRYGQRLQSPLNWYVLSCFLRS